MTEALSTFLFKTEGSSDKFYNLHLRPEGDGWVVGYENGRRGSAPNPGLRTKNGPVSYEAALKVYRSVERSKLADGYTTQEDGVAYAGTDKAGAVTGFQPQLLNEAEQEDILDLLDTGLWAWQIKHDGERRAVLATREARVYSNKLGLATGVTAPIDAAVERLLEAAPEGFELDSEDMGTHLCVFDILAWNGTDLRTLPYEARAAVLEGLEPTFAALGLSEALRISKRLPVGTRADNAARLAQMDADKEEGIVARLNSAPATAGRPNSGGPVRKCKFWKSATVRVIGPNGVKSSVQMEMLDTDTGTWVGVGNCTIPANAAMPAPGSYIEVIYLNANPGGSIYQPRYHMARTDVVDADTRLSQLHYKKQPA